MPKGINDRLRKNVLFRMIQTGHGVHVRAAAARLGLRGIHRTTICELDERAANA